jgi:hypothetical protein
MKPTDRDAVGVGFAVPFRTLSPGKESQIVCPLSVKSNVSSCPLILYVALAAKDEKGLLELGRVGSGTNSWSSIAHHRPPQRKRDAAFSTGPKVAVENSSSIREYRPGKRSSQIYILQHLRASTDEHQEMLTGDTKVFPCIVIMDRCGFGVEPAQPKNSIIFWK